VRRIQSAFLASPGHRRNTPVPPGHHFGVSTWIAGRVIWVTVDFKQVPPGRPRPGRYPLTGRR
jgi:hypothetical protein